MERVLLGGAVLEQGEVQERVNLVGEEWEDPEPGQALEENASVPSVGQQSRTRPESPAPTKNVQSVEQK